MYSKILRDSNFFLQLLKIDEDLATVCKDNHCIYCDSTLDQANYRRKPRGEPPGLPERFSLRLSFCCRKDGCRKRNSPPSLRFMGRRVWVAPMFLIACILSGDCHKSQEAEFLLELGVSKKLLKRWRRWWQEDFIKSSKWVALKGLYAVPVDKNDLPGSLLSKFVKFSSSDPPANVLVDLLKLLNNPDILGRPFFRRSGP